MKSIGLIAGGGQFPILFAKKASEKGYKVCAGAYINEASKELENYVDAIEWLHLGQVGRLLKFFKKQGVTESVMMGSVKKTKIFTDIRPDFKAIAFIATKGQTHDDSILSSFADLLEKEGVNIRPSTFLLPELISPKGCWTRKYPDNAEQKDIKVGWHIAREIGKLDIGQSVVVSNGTVLAVEAIDGTDATIKRGASLTDRGAVVVKLSKLKQDLRFDLPSAGVETINIMAQYGASVLVLEADKSITFDRDKMIDVADKHKISIIAIGDEDFQFKE
ncbi:MAG: UDP-2,3-diacylglucosamine diphosphatase LpxI [Desulfamplus sp.]|nr:UDP-2,3-diacylglucosamine diphosphatase LpxI [Desulfamplus sp.]MBF0389636.1 UDP-2,3-diacylglucosamine diphosphatase LpxI [Desulfamplus sp.]